MTTQTSFHKYSGAGNDFILLDFRSGLKSELRRSALRKLCHRQRGVGADGVLALYPSTCALFRMRIFNSDGSEAEMCGNGLRCAIRHIFEEEGESAEVAVEVYDLIYRARPHSMGIEVEVPPPSAVEWGVWAGEHQVDFLNTGVPHGVLFVPAIEELDIHSLGSHLRFHPRFAPAGINVNFARLDDSSGEVWLRTYERGVEGETLACGTGAMASALAAAHRLGRARGPIVVHVRSGDRLEVDFILQNGRVDKLWMRGPAHRVFSGQVDLNSLMSYPW